ncbi:hypothetical protein SH139x_001796 [Planctomycetaceae bacterium SH139]
MNATLERRNSKIALALMVPVVPATGLGITLPNSEQIVERPESNSPGWDRLDYSDWSVLDRLQQIRHSNRQSRRLDYDNIYFNVGTGASEPADFVVAEAESNRWRRAIDRTRATIVENMDRVREQLRPAVLPTKTSVTDVAAAVADVRSSLSLSITELSVILDVKRPTIYSWLRGDSQPHPHNLERISFLHQISQRWNELSGRPLHRQLRHAFDGNGTTLFALLKSEELDNDEIENHLLALAKLPPARKPPSMKDLSAKHGLPTKPHPDSDLVRDIESGRRLTND